MWSREELIEAFIPVWEKIYFQEPEGILFRMPVDPVALGVPVSDGIILHNINMYLLHFAAKGTVVVCDVVCYMEVRLGL